MANVNSSQRLLLNSTLDMLFRLCYSPFQITVSARAKKSGRAGMRISRKRKNKKRYFLFAPTAVTGCVLFNLQPLGK